MQGIQPGGGRHIDAMITGLERALNLMPVEPMPGLLSQLRRLRALIWVRLMMVPTSGTRELSLPERLLEVAEAAERLGVSADNLFRHAKHGMVKSTLMSANRGAVKWDAEVILMA